MNMTKPNNSKKVCYFCSNDIKIIDYKNVILLRKYINTVGKILPRKKSGNCSKHQRMVSQAVKRARILSLLPFVAK
ncbi:MAG: 30S ribosomal protein S18 [Candidatus Moranbacteria bacterium]|nr:30S ribosomal protein S18 [Candidatus Moranbacteria bacterium]